jgi:recombination protein RecT
MAEAPTNLPVAQPTRSSVAPLNKIKTLQELFDHPDFYKRIVAAAPKHMKPERMLRTFVIAVQKTPKLMKANPLSMLGVFTTLAALGLEPNTPLQHAHLIPFDVNKWNKETRQRDYVRTDVQLIIGYPGYIDLIFRGDKIKDIDCQVVWPGDEFSYEHGSDKHLRHRPNQKPRDPKMEPLYAYMHTRMANGGEQFEVMTAAEVLTIRGRSQGFRTAMAAYDDCIKKGWDPAKNSTYSEAPWIKNPIPMWRKTPLRAGQKWLPKTVELAAALGLDDAADEGMIDYSKVIDGEAVLDGAWEAPADVIEHDQTPSQNEAFGLRTAGGGEPAPVPVEDERPAAQQQTRQTAPKTEQRQAPAAEQAKPPTQRKWELYLVNEDGEMIDGGFHADPVAYARSLTNLLLATAAEFREAVLDANGDYIAQVQEHPVAKSIILNIPQATGAGVVIKAEVLPSAEQTEADGIDMTVQVPTRGQGQQDLKGYVAEIGKSLMQLVIDSETLRDWLAANSETIGKMPRATRAGIEQAISARAAILELEVIGAPGKYTVRETQPEQTDAGDGPPSAPLPGETQQRPEPAETQQSSQGDERDLRRLEMFREAIADLSTRSDLRAYHDSTIFQTTLERWKAEGKQELYDQTVEIMRLRLAEVDAKAS